MSKHKLIKTGKMIRQGFFKVPEYEIIDQSGAVIESSTDQSTLIEKVRIHNTKLLESQAPKRKKCGYADKYKAIIAPTCGCSTCEDKWNRRFMGGSSTLIGGSEIPFPWREMQALEGGYRLGEVQIIGASLAPSKPKYTLESAQRLISEIWDDVMESGYYLALSGGTLYNGSSNNDFDLVAVPRNEDSDKVNLIRVLEHKIYFEPRGEVRIKSRGRPIDLYHYTWKGYDIDLAIVRN